MNIAHLTQSVTTNGGGISEVIRALASAQDRAGDHPQVVSVVDHGEPLDPWSSENPHLLEPRKFPGILYLPELGRTLDRLNPGVTHVHGLWTYLSIGVPGWGKKTNVPSVVSPHGMLDAWALANSRWKKRIASAVFERRHLEKANCLHALCQSEAASIRAFGVKGPVATIPNGIDLPLDNDAPYKVDGKDRNILLFLGRLHPKKGLMNALRAWAAASNDEDWQFVITGWDQEGHEEELKQLCEELGLRFADQKIHSLLDSPDSVSVIFTGPAFGSDKISLLKMASAFILPSFSEGLPMSILEAWAYRLPIVMTEFCNLPEGFEAEAAVKIGTDTDSITEGLRTLFSASGSDLREIAGKGRLLVEEKFTWKKIAADFRELYRWLDGSTSKPNFVE